MPRTRLLVAALLALGAPADAQQGNSPAPITQPGPPRLVEPGAPAGATVVPGGRENSGPGSAGVIAPTGTGAATITTDSAAGGNAGQPERGVPQVGSGGGDSGGGGGGS